MEIKRIGSQPSWVGSAETFTGSVRIDPLFQRSDLARVLGLSVTFEACARTAWHTHPLGQTLIVTAGCGRMQRWGGPIEEIRPGAGAHRIQAIHPRKSRHARNRPQSGNVAA